MVGTKDENSSASVKRLAGKVALVTGASRGIGAAIALRLAREGATVAISYLNKKNQADEVVAKINKLGAQAFAYKANVTSLEATRQMIEGISKTAGKIDILVNNAGIYEGAT